MSAISAIYHIDKRLVLESDLIKINDAMRHHGCDGSKLWIDQQCGLAQQLTRLTSESRHEILPYVDDSHQIALVCHCRLFNRNELCEQLNISAHNPKIADSELIVLAYLQWKLDFVNYLIGEFSFVLWDKKTQQFLCVTDHFNSRPLYYYADQKMVVVASEITALFQLNTIPRRPNFSKIARSDFMRLQLEPGETCFETIYSLPPASMMIQNASGCIIKQYWQPELKKPLSFASDVEFRDEFQTMFSRTIQSTTRTHLPICLQLSGGLDSSAIAVMAARQFEAQGRKLICLSNVLPASYDGPLKDELDFINLLDNPNLIKKSITDEWRGPFDHLNQFGEYLHTSPQHYQYRAINAVARQQGAKIILHGTLGEITSSYAGHEYLAYLFRYGYWLKLLREIFAHKKNYQRSYMAILASNVMQYQRPRLWKTHPQSSSRQQLLEFSLINKNFISQHIQPEQLEQMTQQFLTAGKMTTVDPRQNALFQLKNFLQHSSTMFSQMNDAPASSIYSSNPYFDKRWVEFCLNIPNEYRFKNGYPRSIIRIGLQNVLPEKICWRTSKGPFLPDYHKRYDQQLTLARCAVEELGQNALVQEVINIKQLKRLLTNQSNTSQEFINYLVIPRIIYLAKFLSSF